MTKYLKPISKDHSITKAVVTFYIPQAIIEPDVYFRKAIASNHFNHFQKKGLTTYRHINIDKDRFNISENKTNGFSFEEYNYGNIANLLQLINIDDHNAKYVFETREYLGWKDFRRRVVDELEKIKDVIDFFVSGLSLTYLDEFLWENETKIDVEKIFNQSSELLNKKFFDSQNGFLSLISQKEDENMRYEEKTEVTFNNTIKRIALGHEFASVFDKSILIKDFATEDVFIHLEKAHQANRDILRDVLSEETCEIIKLPK